jgi:tetratricopeptide (TPR) repeat protein
MRALRRHVSALPLAAMMGLAALVVATPPASADPARARAHFDLGKRYFEVDEYRKAMEEFKAAHIEEPDPAFLYNIAECHRHLGENREALVFYRRFLQLAPANAPARPSIEKRIAELQARIRDEPPAAPAAAGVRAPAAPPASASASSSTSTSTAPAGERPAGVRPALEPTAVPAASPALTLATEPNAAPESPPASARPFYKSGWFYAVVGGALLAGTLGVWALSSGKGTSIPETPLGNQSAFR